MGILWLIIKIILFVLLALLGLILLGLLIILISPISYEAYLEKYDELIYDIKFTYLGLVCGHFCLEKGYKNHEIKAFGKVLYEDKVKENPEEKETIPKKETTLKKEEISLKNKTSDKEVPKKKGKSAKQQRIKQKRVNNHQTKTYDQVKDIDTPVVEEIQETTESAVREVKAETKGFTENLDKHQLKELLFTKDFWQIIKETFSLIKSIVKYILPRQWSYELIIGKDDPADTGELLAKLTMLYPLYYKHGIVRGDFERSGIWGGFLAKGKFSILGILKRIVIFLFRPVVREYIKLILKIRKEEEHGK